MWYTVCNEALVLENIYGKNEWLGLCSDTCLKQCQIREDLWLGNLDLIKQYYKVITNTFRNSANLQLSRQQLNRRVYNSISNSVFNIICFKNGGCNGEEM